MASNYKKNITVAANGVFNVDENGMCTLSIENMGDIPIGELFSDFNNEEVSVTFKLVTELD